MPSERRNNWYANDAVAPVSEQPPGVAEHGPWIWNMLKGVMKHHDLIFLFIRQLGQFRPPDEDPILEQDILFKVWVYPDSVEAPRGAKFPDEPTRPRTNIQDRSVALKLQLQLAQEIECRGGIPSGEEPTECATTP
jgi:hypothetical protein